MTTETSTAVNEVGLANWLAINPDISGVGEAKASQFAAIYSGDLGSALSGSATDLQGTARASGIKYEIIRDIARNWRENPERMLAGIHLARHDLTWWQINKVLDSNAYNVLMSSPWSLVGKIKGLGFKKIDGMALKTGADPSDPLRVEAACKYVLEDDLSNGHTWMYSSEVLKKAAKLLDGATVEKRDIQAAVERLIDAQEVDSIGGGRVALPYVSAVERYLARTFRELSAERVEGIVKEQVEAALFKVEEQSNVCLNHEQRAAVLSSFLSRATLLTGGAGTGKTLTISMIVRCASHLGFSVKLAAPTGKAARRMEEVVGIEAFTLHRLLRWTGEGFLFTDGNSLPNCDVLIVDEVSMVDIDLMRATLRALAPHTRIVLVGDHNQLPSVGPGAVLRDLVQTRAIHVSLLNKVMRQAGALKINSMAILDGKVADNPEERAAWWVVKHEEPHELRAWLVDLFGRRLVEKYGKDAMRHVQLLSPMRKGPIGCDMLNLVLQREMQSALYGVEAPPPDKWGRPRIILNDRVIQTVNDYNLDVMNGEQGVVEEIGANRFVVRMDDGRAVNYGKKRGGLRLAYCLTIHKSQGSEYPVCIVVAHSSHSFMLHRNLFYTGVTRARKTAVIVGNKRGISTAAWKIENEKRRTLLGELLERGE